MNKPASTDREFVEIHRAGQVDAVGVVDVTGSPHLELADRDGNAVFVQIRRAGDGFVDPWPDVDSAAIARAADGRVTVTAKLENVDPAVIDVLFGIPAVSDGRRPTLRERIRCFLRFGHDWHTPDGYRWDFQRCTRCRSERFID